MTTGGSNFLMTRISCLPQPKQTTKTNCTTNYTLLTSNTVSEDMIAKWPYNPKKTGSGLSCGDGYCVGTLRKPFLQSQVLSTKKCIIIRIMMPLQCIAIQCDNHYTIKHPP